MTSEGPLANDDPDVAPNRRDDADGPAETPEVAGPQPSADQASADQASADQASADQSSADQSSADQASADQASTDQASTDPEPADPAAADQELADLRAAFEVQRERVVEERARVIDMLTAERHDRQIAEASTAAAFAEERHRADTEAEVARTTLIARAEHAELDAAQLRIALREREDKITALATQNRQLQRHLDAVFDSRTMRLLRPARNAVASVRPVLRKGRRVVRRAVRLVRP